MRTTCSILILAFLGAGCASEPPGDDAIILDFTHTRGAYILGYSADRDIRTRFEDQLVADLAARDIQAWPSHPDIPDATATDRKTVLAAANAKQAMFVVLAEQVPPGAQAVSQASRPERITHEHPDLEEFYKHTRADTRDYDPSQEVFVEVSAYLIQDDRTKLFWSGTTWSFAADGEGTAIRDISTTIADAIAKARERFLAE